MESTEPRDGMASNKCWFMIGPTVGAVTALLSSAALSQERTVVEELIVDQNPCAGLVTEQLGQRIGIEELESISLPEADIALRGDNLTVRFSGALACKAPEGSIIIGNASADISAEGRLSLATCETESLSVSLSNFRGTFGTLLAAIGPELETELAEKARSALVQGCREFRGRSG